MDSKELLILCESVFIDFAKAKITGNISGAAADAFELAQALKSRLEKEQTHVLVPREPTFDG